MTMCQRTNQTIPFLPSQNQFFKTQNRPLLAFLQQTTSSPIPNMTMNKILALYSLATLCATSVAFVVTPLVTTRSSSSLHIHPDDAVLFDRIFKDQQLDEVDAHPTGVQVLTIEDDVTDGSVPTDFQMLTLDQDPDETLLDRMVEEWNFQANLLTTYENSIASDGYLSDLVVYDDVKAPNKRFMEKEMHRHDSLLNEILHAMESDPDLDGIMN